MADQKKQAGELMAHPQQLNKMAFEQGIGFVPYGSVGLQAVQTIAATLPSSQLASQLEHLACE